MAEMGEAGMIPSDSQSIPLSSAVVIGVEGGNALCHIRHVFLLLPLGKLHGYNQEATVSFKSVALL